MKTNKFVTKTMILMGSLVISLALCERVLAEGPNRSAPIVKAMTYNIFIGADIDIILDEFNPSDPVNSLVRGVTLFLQAVQNTDFPERAESLADEIQRRRPDLIGLQEVALFELIRSDDPKVITYLDYKEILLAALRARNLDYEAAVTADNTTVTFPFPVDIDNDGVPDGVGLQFTDRDAILVRKNVTVSNAEVATFETLRAFPPIPSFIGKDVIRGYAALDATVRGKTYRFAVTHLENEGDNPDIQDAQTAELIEDLEFEDQPVILVGDFNSGPSIDQPIPRPGSPYDQLVEAGYIDAWAERKGPRTRSGDPGFTCCQDKDLRNIVSELDKRIDLIWIRPEGLPLGINEALARTTVEGDDPKEKTPSGLWPSDHAGVDARMNVP
jgi:endonuclease/exonuclease/phosphatase family metal-dependent hydrolase